jgi:hypothetical protein
VLYIALSRIYHMPFFASVSEITSTPLHMHIFGIALHTSHFTPLLTPHSSHTRYCWKLCYIHMLGYDVDFGHTEIITLISSSKYQEKSVG